MRPCCYLLTVTLTVLGLLLLPCPSSCELIELSYTFNKDAPNNPKYREFTFLPVTRGKRTNRNSWTHNEFCSSEHAGTHVDAPIHYDRRGWTLDAIPTSRFWRRPGVMVDVSKAVQLSPILNYEVQLKQIQDFEKKHGVIPDGAVVLVRTGQAGKVGNITAYSGGDQQQKFNHPGLGSGAADFLANHGKRYNHSEGVVGVGIDGLSIDKGSSALFPAHRALFAQNIYALKNLANLEKLPPIGFYVTVMPLKIAGGSGAPARVVAETGDTITMRSDSSKPTPLFCSSILSVVMVSLCAFLPFQ